MSGKRAVKVEELFPPSHFHYSLTPRSFYAVCSEGVEERGGTGKPYCTCFSNIGKTHEE